MQPFRHFTKNNRVYQRTGFVPATANAPPYLVREILNAYNADGLGVTGKDERIAILIDTFPHDDDLTYFWTKNSLPIVSTRITKINVNNVDPTLLPALEGEESLDTQWASGIARDANVSVYACGSLDFVALDSGLDRIIDDATADTSLRQLSISLGLGELYLSPNAQLDGELKIENDKFLKLAAMGVNVFVSSGDAGSNPDQFGHSGGTAVQVEWMSSCPFVVGVGGTSLRLAGTGAVSGEVAWIGSGGGISRVFPRPGYQNLREMPANSMRLVPDVSLVADPNTGVYIRVGGQDQQIGGTSLSAPVWAGFCALLNASRTKAGKRTLPFLNPLIYPLNKTKCFRNITSGTNGAFKAGLGYNMVTGLGVPDVKSLMNNLLQTK